MSKSVSHDVLNYYFVECNNTQTFTNVMLTNIYMLYFLIRTFFNQNSLWLKKVKHTCYYITVTYNSWYIK